MAISSGLMCCHVTCRPHNIGKSSLVEVFIAKSGGKSKEGGCAENIKVVLEFSLFVCGVFYFSLHLYFMELGGYLVRNVRSKNVVGGKA